MIEDFVSSNLGASKWQHGLQQKKEEFWRTVFVELRGSGKSVKQFCRDSDFFESAFYTWRTNISQRDQPAQLDSSSGSTTSRLIPVSLFADRQSVEVRSAMRFRRRLAAASEIPAIHIVKSTLSIIKCVVV
ncbi:IS66 family insertion sequence element accessory protein TnpA [Roseiconus lacunae]|uniref:IS66 family insertion sequence element accessory protein TnpA n=1 Tax=Roseiconus lacunae TaxID=2605694 RepID=UPI0036F39789